MSFEFNKIAAAVLLAGIVAMFSGFIARELFHIERPEEMAYTIATAEGGGHEAVEPEAVVIESVLPLLASADVAKGEALFKTCSTCHTNDKGGANKVGPNLWDIVGREHAAHEGFNYSDALKAFAGQPWSYEELNHFLFKPKDYAPGTKMSFAGMKKVGDRADIIAYLRTLADDPAPLPTQEEIDAVQKAAMEPAEGAAADTAHADAATTEGATTEGETTEGTTSEGTTSEGGAAEAASGDGGNSELLTAIADADPARGEKVAKQCAACHTFDQGGPNKVGPNLYGVIGGPMGHLEGYNYSKAFEEAHAAGRTWDYSELDAYLAKPRDFLPGNKMTFAGLKKAEDRAAVIAYMRQQSDNPPPLE